MATFGQAPAASAAPAPLFGGSTTFGTSTPFGSSAPAFGASTSTFGATSAPAFGTSTPAFGAPSTAPTFGTSTPAFGASTTSFGASTPAFGAPSTTPAFGAPSTTPAFGAPSTTPAFGGFGASTPAFGAPSTTPAFGASTSTFGTPAPAFGASTTPTTPGFGTSTPFSGFPAQTTPSAFSSSTPFSFNSGGAPSTPLFGNNQASPTAFNQNPQNYAPTPQQRVAAIQDSYNPASQNCRFRCMLYNSVNPAEVGNYKKPDNVSQKLWDDAVERNPDSKSLVPVQASGFSELQERMDAQQSQAQKHQKTIEAIRKQVEEMQRKQSVQIQKRIEEYKDAHMVMSQRILAIVGQMETRRWQGWNLREGQELDFLRHVQRVNQELTQTNSIRGRLNEVSMLTAMQDNGDSMEMDYHADPEELQRIRKFLEEQANGIKKLKDRLTSLETSTDTKIDGIAEMRKH